jgi:hypothetical protein
MRVDDVASNNALDDVASNICQGSGFRVQGLV